MAASSVGPLRQLRGGRAGVVTSGSQRHGALEVVQRQLEIGGADGDVGVAVVDHVRA
jgi:hypothetical protein